MSCSQVMQRTVASFIQQLRVGLELDQRMNGHGEFFFNLSFYAFSSMLQVIFSSYSVGGTDICPVFSPADGSAHSEEGYAAQVCHRLLM